MIIHDVEQRTAEWYELRKGVITASNAHRLLTPAKRKTYQMELLAEILSGQITEHYVNEAMQWGIDNEEKAIAEFAKKNPDSKYWKYGFCTNENIPNVGCSPDLVFQKTNAQHKQLVEIKCLSTKNHLDGNLFGIDADYVAQIQFQMLVTDFEFALYLGYDPRLPEKLQLYTVKVDRDEKMIERLKEGIAEVNGFIDEFLLDNGLPRQARKYADEDEYSGFF